MTGSYPLLQLSKGCKFLSKPGFLLIGINLSLLVILAVPDYSVMSLLIQEHLLAALAGSCVCIAKA